MGRVRVVRNDLPDVIKQLNKNIDKQVDDTAREMARDLAAVIWYRYGYVQDATVARTRGLNHAEVWCGFNRDKGFYSRFQEWGTIYQRPRPLVGPMAHGYEPIFARDMSRAVKDACNRAGTPTKVDA